MRKSGAVSARAWVHDTLENEILMGNVAAGDALVELRIAEKMGVSRTPVREALRELSQEGLVDYFPNRGMFVRGISTQDVRDVYTVRIMLEEQAVRWAVERMDKPQEEELTDLMRDMEAIIRDRCPDPRTAVLDTRFHQLLYRLAGSTMLERTLQSLERFLMRARSLSLKNQGRAAEVVAEHYAIAKALMDRNAENAVQAMRSHIFQAMQEVLTALEAMEASLK